MRPLLTLSLAVSMLVVSAGAALAHAGLMPGELAPGTPTESELVIVHGCGPDGTIPANDEETLPTTAVTLQRLDGLTFAPREVEGWSLTTDLDAHGDVQQARWEFDDPAGTLDVAFFGVEVTADVALDGARLHVPVIQDCIDGEQLAWVADVESADQLPGMLVTVDSSVTAIEPVRAEGASPTLIAALAIALGLAAGAATVLVSRRRA